MPQSQENIPAAAMPPLKLLEDTGRWVENHPDEIYLLLCVPVAGRLFGTPVIVLEQIAEFTPGTGERFNSLLEGRWMNTPGYLMHVNRIDSRDPD